MYIQAQWQIIHLQCWSHRRHGFDSWIEKNPWRRAWQPTLVFLFGGHRQATVHRVATEVTEQACMCIFKVLKQKDILLTKTFAHQCCPSEIRRDKVSYRQTKTDKFIIIKFASQEMLEGVLKVETKG